jgi:hypothetical protein
MLNPGKPSIVEWVLSVAVFVAGVIVFRVDLSQDPLSSPAEKELTLAEGIATSIRELEMKDEKIPYFTIGDHNIQYGSIFPKYDDVKAAVKSGKRIQAWIPTQPAGYAGRLSLYKLNVENKPVLSFADASPVWARGGWTGLVGGSLMALGALGTVWCIFRSFQVVF